MSGWIGVDLDGTLAVYKGWGDGSIGEPVPAMAARVKAWLAEGRDVRIFTARVAETGLRNQIDMDKKCAECGKPGALGSGICMRCATKAMDSNRQMKTREGRAVQKRYVETLRNKRG